MQKKYLEELMQRCKDKTITIIGHDKIDIDSALSGILLSKLLNFLGITNSFHILEAIKEDETYTIIKELFEIDLKDFEYLSEDPTRNLFLVDHYKSSHLGQVLGYIDHHPTLEVNENVIAFSQTSSATACLIYNFMKIVEYPLTKQDAEMIAVAMMADTVCFKSSKCVSSEITVIEDLSNTFGFDLNKIKNYCLCITPIDKMTIDEIITNGAKKYNFGGAKVSSAYIQVVTPIDNSTRDKWFKHLIQKMIKDELKMYVFLIYDLEACITYEYQITQDYIKEVIHDTILSRGNDIMPNIEKLFLSSRFSTEQKITKLIELLFLTSRNIATMESCTGGQLASEITNVSGASNVLHESYITYCNNAKIRLGVSKTVIDKCSVYSYETAMEMANAVSKYANASIGIGITGQLGRIDPNNPGISDNQVWYAIKSSATQNFNTIKLYILADVSREVKKKIVIKNVVETLYDYLV